MPAATIATGILTGKVLHSANDVGAPYAPAAKRRQLWAYIAPSALKKPALTGQSANLFWFAQLEPPKANP